MDLVIIYFHFNPSFHSSKTPLSFSPLRLVLFKLNSVFFLSLSLSLEVVCNQNKPSFIEVRKMEASSEFFTGGYFSHGGDREFHHEQKPAVIVDNNNNNFAVDDLLDFPKEDEVMTDAFFDSITGNSGDSSSLTVVDSCNSSISGGEPQFNGSLSSRSFTDAQFSGGELCVPVLLPFVPPFVHRFC